MLTGPKERYHTGQRCVNPFYVYSICSALQALLEHFFWSVHYSHALHNFRPGAECVKI